MLISLKDTFKRSNTLEVPQKGIVVDNNDPLKLDRVRCRVDGIFSDDDVEALPWISPDKTTSDINSRDIPEIGTIVTVTFPSGDIYSPFYSGAWVSSETSVGNLNGDYPNQTGSRDPSGTKTTTNKAKGFQEIEFPSGVKFRVASNGDVTLLTKGKFTVESDEGNSSISMDSPTGNIDIKAKSSSSLTGNQTRISSKEHKEDLGSLESLIKGSELREVIGGRKVSVGGSESKSIAGNQGLTVAGKSSHLHADTHEITYGAGTKETVATLNKEVEVLLGKYVMNALLGGYELTGLSATLKALTLAKLEAPIVHLGANPIGPIVTTITDPIEDYITGKPKIGQPTILA